MLRRFAVSGFRNLGEIDLELGKLNVIIGPNNGGKSNLCEAIETGRRLVTAGGHNGVDLTAVLDELGGVYLPNWNGDRRVSFRWSLDDGLDYHVAFDIPRDPDRWQSDWRIVAERVGWNQNDYAEPEGPNRETIVAHVGQQVRRIANAVGPKYGMASSTGWRPVGQSSSIPSLVGALAELSARFDGSLFTSFARHAGARDQRAQPRDRGNTRLSPTGINLASVLRELEQKPPFLDPVLERLKHLVGGLRRVSTEDATGLVWVNLTVGEEQRPLYTFSDGTVQALRLAMLLFRTPHGLVLVDEPELSLHPAWQRHVARWFLESDRQAVVATHSPELLDAWTDAFLSGEARLFVLERGSARAVDVNTLQAWLKDGWQVGDLYRTGNPILGGWPG